MLSATLPSAIGSAPVPPPANIGSTHYSMAVNDLGGNAANQLVYASDTANRVWTSLGEGSSSTLATILPGIKDPTAITLGDLSGDGIDDLVICDGEADRVFVYLGLGGGRFGAEINGGAGLPTGISPDAVAVIPPQNGNGPELAVTDKGSDDVVIFERVETANGWNLVQKERAPVGPDPTSVLAQDITGNVGPDDLVVTNGGDNTVSILPGTGQGLFDDSSARVLPTGELPVQALVGDFDGRTDLVTVDSGSDDLTFYSNVASPNPVAVHIPTGGVDPVAAVALGANNDGRSDLVVANYGDGMLSLFSGGSSGLTLTQSLQESGQHPAALAVTSELAAGSFYVLSAGQAFATLQQFNLAESASTYSATAPAGESTASVSGLLLDQILDEGAGRIADWLGPGRTIGTDLQSIGPSTAAVVPGVAMRSDVLPSPSGLNDPLSTTEEERPKALARGETVPALTEDEHPNVQRFIIGVDQEPAPRIGPDGASIEETTPVSLPEALPETRRMAPSLVRKPLSAPPSELSAEAPAFLYSAATTSATDTARTAEVATNVEREISASTTQSQPRRTRTLLLLAAFGLVLGRRTARRQPAGFRQTGGLTPSDRPAV